jgi:hypothetical protein
LPTWTVAAYSISICIILGLEEEMKLLPSGSNYKPAVAALACYSNIKNHKNKITYALCAYASTLPSCLV